MTPIARYPAGRFSRRQLLKPPCCARSEQAARLPKIPPSSRKQQIWRRVSVDDQLIGDRATQIKTLTNGCICCTRS